MTNGTIGKGKVVLSKLKKIIDHLSICKKS